MQEFARVTENATVNVVRGYKRTPPQNRCEKGHRPPIVQRVKTGGAFRWVCTRCQVSWTAVEYVAVGRPEPPPRQIQRELF